MRNWLATLQKAQRKESDFLMVRYSLPSNPNFTMSCTPEDMTYVMTFKYIKGLMYLTVFDIEGTRIAGPVRICEGRWLIPHQSYNYEGAGNFVILEINRQYPIFDIFNTSCELRYYTREEIDSGDIDFNE